MLKDIRKSTARVFAQSRLSLLCFSIVIIIFSAGIFCIRGYLLRGLSGVLRSVISFGFTLAAEAVCAPVIVGAYEWIMLFSDGRHTPMKNAFGRFSDLHSIFSSIKAVFASAFLLRICLLPSAVMLYFVSVSPYEALYTNALFLICAVILSLKLLCSVFLVMHIMIKAPLIPLFKAIKLSFGAMRGRFRDFSAILSSTLMWGILSYFSFGLLLVYALPHMLCTVVFYCDAVYESNHIYKYNLYY